MRSAFLLLLLIRALPAGAQQNPDRGTLIIRMSRDTVVVDRFVRRADTLRGSMMVRGQPRVDYIAALGPRETVRTLTLAIFAPGAAPDAAPVQRIRLTVRGDSVIAETPAGVHRIPSKPGAIPMLNNALALSELFTRRARATGGSVSIPYFAVNGGTTLDITVSPQGADSMIVAMGQQQHRVRVDAAGRILGGVITGTRLEVLRGPADPGAPEVRIADTPIATNQDYSAPPGAPYRAEEVKVAGPGGITLGGTLTLPGNARAPFPAVVTITGSGQQDRDEYIPFSGGIRLFRQVADTLSRRGIAVLRLDDRGVGASGGDPQNATSSDFADDIRSAIGYLRSRPDIDGARIAVVGHSEGGAIGPMVAAGDPRLRALVVMAGPGETGLEISMAQNRYLVDRDSLLTPRQRDSILRETRAALDPARQTNPWIRAWMAYDPAPVARQVKAPTLILQGATDRQVPVEQADKLAALIRAGGNRDVTVRIIPATNHLFVADPSGDFRGYDQLRSNRVGPEVLGPLADWLADRLGVKRSGP